MCNVTFNSPLSLPPPLNRWLSTSGTFGAANDVSHDDGELMDGLVPGNGAVDTDAFALNPSNFFGSPSSIAPGSPPNGGSVRVNSHGHNPYENNVNALPTRNALPTSSSLLAFSFEPEDDPVVCRMVASAQEQARQRVAQANANGHGNENVNGQPAQQKNVHDLDPATLKKRKLADLERRLNVKRKYAELASVVERLAVKAETHGSARDELSAAADAAAVAARDAERRRKAALAASSSSGGRRAGNASSGNLQSAVKPFDVAAFTSLKQKREVEILHKQGLTSLKQLMNHKWAFPFNMPVDHVTLGLTTYPEIVKEPMDLGTVRRLAEGTMDASDKAKSYVQYTTCEELHKHVALTFKNAKLYNSSGTDVHVMAVALEEFWAPRWESLKKRSEDVAESLVAERECAFKNSEEIKARRALANEEMRCAGIAADLDSARRRLEDLKRSTARSTLTMNPDEVKSLASQMKTLPKGYRSVARDLVAETDGAHKVPVDGVDRWVEVLEDLPSFGAVAHRRLARFTKVRKRNRIAISEKFCAKPTEGFDAGGVDFEFVEEKDDDLKDEKDAMDVDNVDKDVDIRDIDANGTANFVKHEPKATADATDDALAAAAAAAAAEVGSRDSENTAGNAVGGEDPLLALAMGVGDDRWNQSAAESNPELVRLVSGGER